MSYLSKGIQFSLLVHTGIFLLVAGINCGIYESGASSRTVIDFCVIKEIQEEVKEIKEEETSTVDPNLPVYAMDFRPMDMMAPEPLIKAEPLQAKPKKVVTVPKTVGKPKRVTTEETNPLPPPLKTDENRENPPAATSNMVSDEPSDTVSGLAGTSFSDDSSVPVPFPAGGSGNGSDAGNRDGVIGGTGSNKDGKELAYGTAGSGKGDSDVMAFGSATGPKFRHMEMPVYPHNAKRLGKEGKVLLMLTIDKNGNLIDIEVLEDSGYGFAEAAVAAVKKSTFIPSTVNGQQITARALLPVKFTLK